MDDKQPDLAQRLRLLEQILGESCRVTDEPSEWEAYEKNLEKQNEDTKASQEVSNIGDQLLAEEPSPVEYSVLNPPADLYHEREPGTQGEKNLVYCSWQIITSYPEHFIGKTNRQKALPFFEKILQSTKWDFYYVHDYLKPKEPAHLLVPTSQLEYFLVSINAVLDTRLRIPSGPHRKLFFLKFPFDDISRPRYLLSHRPVKVEDEAANDDANDANAEFLNNSQQWPVIAKADIDTFHESSAESKEAWMSVMELLKVELNKHKADAEERRKRRKERDAAELQKIAKVLADTNTVFIAIDFEAIEVSPHPISEVGISIVDPRELQTMNPGDKGENWWPLIKAHHLRIHEYAGLRNYRHVQGWPENFNFGDSVIVPKADVAAAILNIFEPYTSKERTITLVGHDLGQDTRYLYKVGVDLEKLASSIDQVDTQRLHKAWKDLDQQRNLGRVLDDLELSYEYLHNAGNDAMYTLRVMLAIAVAVGKGTREKGDQDVEKSSSPTEGQV